MIFEMADIHMQHINIKFCFNLGNMFTETHEMMKNVYGDQSMSCTRCYEWFKQHALLYFPPALKPGSHVNVKVE
jgi:hypothetical protein